jgi:DNA-binding XRE family transcriptional regulator
MENKDRYSVTKMTGLFGVSRSAYYRWEKQEVSDRAALCTDDPIGSGFTGM